MRIGNRPLRTFAASAVLALLTACASVAQRPELAPAQPLQRLNLAQIAAPESGSARDSLTLQMAAEFALSAGNLDEAVAYYAQAAQASDNPAIAAQAARVAISAKQWRAARAGVARWQTLQPDASALWQARAILALHDGKTEAAYADLLRLAQQPNAAGWRPVALALMETADKQQSAEVLQRLATPDLLGAKAATWVAVSQLASHLGDLALAQSLADAAVKKFSDADAYAWAAQLKYHSGDKAGARELFAAALKRDGKNTRLRVAYAALLGQMDDNAEAARILAQGSQDEYTYAARAAYAARADNKPLIDALYRELSALPPPRSGTRLNLLGMLAELLEHNAQALDWYRQVPNDDSHWFQAQMRTALLLDGQGNTTGALDMLHRLQAGTGDDDKQLGDAFMLEAEILAKHGRGAEAVAVYDRGMNALPDDARLLYARALLNADLNHVDAAVRDLRHLIQLQPDNADALNALGYTLADSTGHRAEALALIEKALALKPGEPAIIDSLGWVQYRLGHLDEALTHLRAAYAKQPDPEIAAHLGEVLWVSGQKAEARKIWAQGRKKDAKDKVLMETIKRLES